MASWWMGLERGCFATSLVVMCPPWHTWDREQVARSGGVQAGQVAGSIAVEAGDPAAAPVGAASFSAMDIARGASRTAAPEAVAVFGEP